jgi:general secretion pathway protein K
MEVSRRNQRRGAALMLSLWALFLLSAMVISWTLEISSRLALSGKLSRILEAEAMACSGAEIAMHPQTKPDSGVLVGRFGKGQRYEARLTGEGGRINLNWVTQMPENPARLEVLRKYLENKGFDLDERDRMIDTLLDWVDPDNLVRLNGAEEEGGYKPPNRPLARLDELKKIKGWEEFTSSNDWDADFTLDSQPGGQQGGQPGGLNLAWASRDVILSLPGMSEDRVDQFLALRAGADGIVGTEDDEINSLQLAEVVLGSPPGQLSAIGVVYTPQEPVWRVISVGKSGEVTKTVRVVFVKQPLQLKSWKEF